MAGADRMSAGTLAAMIASSVQTHISDLKYVQILHVQSAHMRLWQLVLAASGLLRAYPWCVAELASYVW